MGIRRYIRIVKILAGNYLYYFGIIGITLLCIILLHFFMKKRDKLRREREENRH